VNREEAVRVLDRLAAGYSRGLSASPLLAQLRSSSAFGRYETTRLPGGITRNTWVENRGPRPGAEALLRGQIRAPDRDPVVVLSSRALESIAHEFFWGEGRETGGVIFGQVVGRRILVGRASGPGTKALRSPRHLVIDEAETYDWELGPSVELGTWHSHLSPGPARPSRTDRRSWREAAARVREESGTGLYVGLIATGDATNPRLRAWVVEADGRIRDGELRGGDSCRG
jgi:proteasome lid subunit RPN8/RPN11